MSLLLLQLLLLLLSILIWKDTVSWHMEKSKRYKFVYSETTGFYENVPVLLRGTFYTYSVSSMKLSSLDKDMKNHEYICCYLKTQCTFRFVQLGKYSLNSRCHPPSFLLAVFAMFLAIILPCFSCRLSYSWNERNVRHFFHIQSNSTSSPGLLG